MYRHNISEMEEAGVTVRSNILAWMDREGDIVDEGSAYGCKVTHAIVRSDYYIIADEVGNNISITLKKDLVALYILWKDRAPIDIGEVDVGGVDIGGVEAVGAVPNVNAKNKDEESDN